MSYEQTTNTSDRSTQVEDILTELANCRIPPRLYRQIVALAGLAEITLKRREIERARLENKRNGDAVGNVGNIRQQTPTLATPIYKEDKIKKVSKYSKGANATLMPSNFSPNQEWAMKDRGWDQAKAAEEAAKFTDYAAAHSKRYSNWDAAWRNWCRSRFQQGSNGNGTSAYTRQPTKKERLGDLLQTLGSGEFWANVSGAVPQRIGNGRADLHGGAGRDIHYLPVRGRENSGNAVGHSNGSSDLFTERWIRKQLVGEEDRDHAAETAKAVNGTDGGTG